MKSIINELDLLRTVRDLCVDQEQQQNEKAESPHPAASFTQEGSSAPETATRTSSAHARPGSSARHHRIERIR